MNRIEIMDNYLRIDTTPSELIQYMNEGYNPDSENRTHQVEPEFCNYSWDDAMYLLEHGWEEGVTKIDIRSDFIKETTSTIDVEQIGLSRGTTGDFFDTGLVLSGEPEPWYNIEMVEMKRQELTIFVNAGVRADISQDQIYNFGAAIFSLIDNLKKRFYVKVIIARKGINIGGKYNTIDYRLHIDTNNHYSRSFLAFALACPAMHRRITFELRDRENDYKIHYDEVGCSIDAEPDTKNVLYFPMISRTHEYATMSDTIRRIEVILKKYREA